MNNNWQEVSVEGQSIWDKQKTLEGELVDVRTNVGPNGSMMYKIKTDKETLGVWGSSVLDTKLDQVSVGSMVRIEPLGMAKSPKSGRTYQDFKVFYKDAPYREVTDEDMANMPADFLKD